MDAGYFLSLSLYLRFKVLDHLHGLLADGSGFDLQDWRGNPTSWHTQEKAPRCARYNKPLMLCGPRFRPDAYHYS